MGILSKVKKAVTKVAKVVTKPVKKVTQAAAKVVKSVSKPIAKAVSSVATGVKKAATSSLKSVGKVAAKAAVTAAKVSSRLGVAGHIIDVALAAYTGGAYAAVKLAAKKVITTYAASVVAKKLASTSKLAASVASALISGGSTKASVLKQAALSATKQYAINKAGQQLAKKSSTLASAFNIYNGVSSVAGLGQQARTVTNNAKQLGRYIAPASRALPAPNQKPTVQTFPLAAKGGATNIRALPSAAGSYTIKKGDTLLAISSRTGVPVADLMKVNGISNPALVRPGTRLSIPAAKPNIGNLAKGAGVGLSKTKTSTWAFRPSPTTRKIGPDAKLKAEAKKLGIKTTVNPRPLKFGEQWKRKNNWNGSQAEVELAKKQNTVFGKAKNQVVYVNGKETTLTSRPSGSRVVDVQKANWAGDIFESKVGATSYSSRVQSQLMADADIITMANGFSSKWSHAAKTTGKILKPVGLVTDGLRVYDAVKADGGSWGQQTNRTLAEVGGGWAGAAGGAALGATAGSVVPVVGTVVGAVVGGIAGAFGGEWLGGQAFGWLNSSAKAAPPKPSAPPTLAASRSAPSSVSWIDSKGLAPVTSAASPLNRMTAPAAGMLASFGR